MANNAGVIHKFNGEWGEILIWEGQRSRQYNAAEVAGVTETWLIGKPENAKNFAMRYYKIDAGGFSHQEQHPYDHGILIVHGQGKVQLGPETHPINQGDVVYIPPDLEHHSHPTLPKQ